MGEIVGDLPGPEEEEEMRAFIAQEIKNTSPGTVRIIFELLAGRESADKMKAFIAREIKQCSPPLIKMVFDLLKSVKNLQGQPLRKNRHKKRNDTPI
jgi:hypothetical protein